MEVLLTPSTTNGPDNCPNVERVNFLDDGVLELGDGQRKHHGRDIHGSGIKRPKPGGLATSCPLTDEIRR